MDRTSAKVIGTAALVAGILFLATSVVRLTRSDPDVVLVIVNSAFGVVLVIAGVRLWQFASRVDRR